MERQAEPREWPGVVVERERQPEIRLSRRLRFGRFELRPASGELFEHTGEDRLRSIKLQPQPAKVLLYLAARTGKLVSRAELQRHLWGDDYFVDQEQGLNYCIRAIRRVLEDEPGDPSYIETVPRRGYRFVAEVTSDPTEPERTPLARPVVDGVTLLAVAAGVGLVLLLLGRRRP